MFVEVRAEEHAQDAEQVDFEKKAKSEFEENQVDGDGWI
jgi:hypothetical protein